MRRWFFGDTELSGVTWENVNGLINRQTYGLAIIDCERLELLHGSRYWALQWIFDYRQKSESGGQVGPIYPVWATSNDLASWTQPFGVQHAFGGKHFGMVIPWCNPFVHEGELIAFFFDSDYGHSQWNPSATGQDRVSVARMPIANFAKMVAP
jgi:hypothetical protein